MEQGPNNSHELIETTDSLEAVSASKSMKNFLFLILFIALLTPQLIFWLDRIGLIEKQSCDTCTDCVQIDLDESQACGIVFDWMPTYLAAETTVAQEAEKVAQQVQQAADPVQEAAAEPLPADTAPVLVDQEASEIDEELSKLRISCSFARGLVAICNYLLLTGAILYSLTILLCLKISLTGRLGGINHITRSFFLSLFLLVLLVPWQVILPKVLIGSIWLPGELLCGDWAKAETSVFWKVLFYARFCGLWFISMWLLLWTQTRSAKWARATLRRLGVVR
ncbi:MAG: hypothetical protein ACYTET_04060 [Planctomycetota bacterium]